MVLPALVLTADRAWAVGEILGQTKEELKLKYNVAVQDHGTGRITVVFTLADQGRLKPLYAVKLVIPGKEKEKDGGRYMDLVVSLDTKESDDGKRVARVHIRRELAERAEIWLSTSSFDGKQLVLTSYHHVIPVAKYLKNAPPAAGKRKAAPAAPAPRPTEGSGRIPYSPPKTLNDFHFREGHEHGTTA
jgi:hypothetical protein